MHVPKAPADIDNFLKARKGQIGGPGKRFDVKSITIAEGMN
jgi:hypothetical protein